jgi:mannose-6-phosphate isomerase-like protein (cupin superfamily)
MNMNPTVAYSKGDRDDRPWGSWEVLYAGESCAIKRIIVSPGHVLSLQRHRHRSEHWILIAGRARVTVDDAVFEAASNTTVFIPRMSIHRIECIGEKHLEFIEVQTGDRLDEADIERLEDKYGRAT